MEHRREAIEPRHHPMTNTTAKKLSFGEKAGYSLGDASANFVFQTMIIFQMAFYTDVFGISAGVAGTLFLVVRFIDACFDPIVGTLADRTHNRWGKFRPWILYSAVPFGLIFWLTFTTPDLVGTARIVYACATYIALMMIYSVNNVPYSALNGVMTGDNQERTSLSAFRFFAAMAATFVVQGLTLPLVSKFGGDNPQHGWSVTIGIYAAVAVVFFIITFLTVRERVQPDPNQKESFKDNLRAISNAPWVAMFLLTLFVFITLALRGTGMYYYFTYYLSKDALYSFTCGAGLMMPTGDMSLWQHVLNAFGLLIKPDHSNVTQVGLGLMNMAGNLVTIVGVLFSTMLVAKFGKKNLFIAGLSGTTIITAAVYFIAPTSIGALFILGCFWSAFYGPTIPVLWAMIADVADYSEWKNKRRATGFVFAGIVFALKAGLGFGGAIAGWILAAYGFEANAAQTSSSIHGIQLAATIYPAIFFAIGVAALFIYPITPEKIRTIQNDLEKRRKAFQQSSK
jgi:glycoside/pentoside/hexuronide:cation symporter, GPH family